MDNITGALKIKELKKKLLLSLLVISCICLATLIPVPAVSNTGLIEIAKSWGDIGILLNVTSVGGTLNGSVVLLGLFPFLSASMLMQILTLVLPKLRNLAQAGEAGTKKISKYTRIATIVMCVLMGALASYGIRGAFISTINFWLAFAIAALVLAAGAAAFAFACEILNTKGTGNGISLILFAGCARYVPSLFLKIFEKSSDKLGIVAAILFTVLGVIIFVAVIVALVFISLGERKVKILFRKMTSGMKQFGVPNQVIPFHINQAGIMPIVYTMTLISIPGVIIALLNPMSDNGMVLWSVNISRNLTYCFLFVVFMVFFVYIFSIMQFNPVDIANEIRNYGGYIQGVKAGKLTTEYLFKLYMNMIILGAVYLTLICCVPMLLSLIPGIQKIWFAGICLVILAGSISEVLTIMSNDVKTHEENEKQKNKRYKSAGRNFR
ncbi:MAG: hypothetical protein K5643_04055 [Saccharofermentans sp.]|nr:hypothetical protein [Saccharofermentans sp.]